MKKLFLIMLGVAILVLPMAINANVDGGAHDMIDGTGSPIAAGLLGLDDVNLCTSCHLPHNATTGAARLWAQAVGGAGGVAGLCQSCHDGTIAALQITTGSLPFTNTLHAHTSETANCSGVETSCHDVHSQNDDGSGKFLATAATSTGLCLDCHDGSFTGTNSNYTLTNQFEQTTNHPQSATLECGDCHSISTVHGTGTVVIQDGSVEPTAGAWLLPIQNNTANAWGGACVACHEDQTAPYTTVIGDNSYPDGVFENSSPATLLGRHVTDGSGPNHSDALGGCDDCHFIHTAGFTAAGNPSINMLQLEDNDLSVGCATCHAGGSAPDYGTNSHPTAFEPESGAPYTTPLAAGFPVSNAIDDAAYGSTNDYESASTFMVCETCHSVHRLGIAGTQFLRAANTNDAVCSACHTSN